MLSLTKMRAIFYMISLDEGQMLTTYNKCILSFRVTGFVIMLEQRGRQHIFMLEYYIQCQIELNKPTHY